ncbi:pectinesterase family protein [uncultured Cetobacterium sp.]|uniref:pectinesterase family protein n=1 Tax=uncultured Cetobacterium sp. TaxID=527638 RepID=UPI0025D5E3F9|nr:pectinesterase family protein [uncultured Cetobacterium sp.]
MLIQIDDSYSLQNVINNIQQEQATIYLKNGIYREKIVIDKPNITLIGEERGKVILVWDDASGTIMRENSEKTYGTTGSASVTITENGKGFTAKKIVFKNEFDYPNSDLKNKQAVALKNDADQSYFEECDFLGFQDTLYANRGRQYYRDSYIEGNVDFIFGGAHAYFENCEIYSIPRETGVGYVMAPSTLETEEIGYIFDNCNFVSDGEKNTIFIGRPWHPGKREGYNPSAVVMNSNLGGHIRDLGWDSMSGFSPDDARFFEYNNRGEGNILNSKRRLLEEKNLESYSKKSIFKDWDI